MKRGIAVLLSLCGLAAVAYLSASKWAIRHEVLTFYDATQGSQPLAIDLAVRRDSEAQADAGLIKLPVAILVHGNAVRNADYSFLANIFAARGYLAISIQQNLPADEPLVTKVGELYVGRLQSYRRAVANIRIAIDRMKTFAPNADYDHLTMVGASNGGDVSMYFAKMYPDEIARVVTLDHPGLPLLTGGKFRMPSFHSKDPEFKSDPGVVVGAEEAEKAGITVVQTGFQHNAMSDRGPDSIKEKIQAQLDEFLKGGDPSPLRPADTSTPAPTDQQKDPPPAAASQPTVGAQPTVAAQPGSNASTSNPAAEAAKSDAACRDRLRRLGIVVVNGPCIDVGEIVDNLAKGQYLFNKPETAYVGESFGFRLALETSSKQDVRQSFGALPGPVTKQEGQFGQSIEATLRGGDFKIEPAGPQPRTATASKPVEWDWTVTPLSGGKKTLTIEVAVNIQVGSDKQRVQLTTLQDDIVIQVSAFQQFRLYVVEANGFLVAAGTTVVSAVVGLIGFVPKVQGFFGTLWRRIRHTPPPNRAARRASAKAAKQRKTAG